MSDPNLEQHPISIAFGSGTNSTAILCRFLELDIKPWLITFADTGGEYPHTYAHLAQMDQRCREWWGMGIEIVRKTYQGDFEGLEKNCTRKKMMPGLAYGRKNCSMKYKVEPQIAYLKRAMDRDGHKTVYRCVGYDAREGHRKQTDTEDLKKGRLAINRYPLIEWNWSREDCVQAICRHGITQPGKSACFFCPASKPSEVYNLRDQHPDLLERALLIEDLAQETITTPRGLGGKNNLWRDWLAREEGQGILLDIEPMHMACGCFDG